MRSEAYAMEGNVGMKLAGSPDGNVWQYCQFDSIEVAEELAHAILAACEEARAYVP